MKTNLICLLFCLFISNDLLISQDINLFLLNDQLVVPKQQYVYDNESQFIDTAFFSEYLILNLELVNNTDDNFLLTNLPSVNYFNGNFAGNRDSLIKHNLSNYFSNESGMCYSVSTEMHNLDYTYISGDNGCIQLELPYHIVNKYSFPKLKDIDELHIIDDYDNCSYDVSEIDEFNHNGIYTLTVLQPNSSYDWTVIFKSCDLSSFERLECNKNYKFFLTYFQGQDIDVPAIDDSDLIIFNGVINSDSTNILYIK